MIPILYEEPHFMLVDKPAGLLTQAVAGIDSLEVQLKAQIRQRDSHPGSPFVGLPHRLDRSTSGILIVARNHRALKRLNAQFQNRIVQKFYVAWIDGQMTDGTQTWQDCVRKVEYEPRAEVVSADTPGAMLAELQIRQVVSVSGQCLALIRLMTGRMHQIRVQLASRGLSIVGDQVYTHREKPNPFTTGEHSTDEMPIDVRRLPHGLHAMRLEFRHPTSAIPMFATATIPEHWNRADPTIRAAAMELAQLSQSSRSAWNLESPAQ